MEILTGVPAGKMDDNGVYPHNTVYGAVKARLQHFREVMQ